MAQPSELPGPDRVAVAIIADRAAIAERVADRLTTRRRVDSGLLSVVVGDLGSVVVAVASPKSPTPDWGQVVRSLRAAHRPERLIAAGLATPGREGSPTPTTAQLGAAIARDGGRYRAAGADHAPQLTAACPGVGADKAAALAEWPSAIAAACVEFDLPLTMLAMVDAADQGGAEWQNLKRQPTAAGKLGAALAGIWQRPAFAKEAVERMASRWKQLDELVDRIEQSAIRANGGAAAVWRRD